MREVLLNARSVALIACVVFLTLAASAARAAAPSMPITAARIDETVARAMRTFEVPGVAVGIVADGQVVYAKGYGVRELDQKAPVDADTLFQIGSNTKAFTAAALAILVDEGKIRWDDKVIDHLPDFRLHDPYVTREFTVRDLLTHRSGLRTGAGDLMFYPATDFTRAEIIHGLRYLKPVAGFRSQYNYDNLLYMVAGEIIPAVTGESWESFVRKRIFEPLEMHSCAARYDLIESHGNMVAPHTVVEGKLRKIPVENIVVIGPAGTISCNVKGMSKWLMTLLAHGQTPAGHKLVSAERIAELTSMSTVQAIDPALAALTRTNFKGYGLGWEVQDEFGRKRVSHTGGVPGTVTWVSMIPELNLGVVVLTNQDDGMAMEAIGHQILDAWLGAPKRDWVNIAAAYKEGRAARASAAEAHVMKVSATASAPPLPIETYVGRYVDSWRGEATVRLVDGGLVLKFSRTDKLEGALEPWSGNIFIVRWNDRSLKADAYVRFTQSFDRDVEGMTLKAVSPATDFSFDFEDLDFRKVQP